MKRNKRSRTWGRFTRVMLLTVAAAMCMYLTLAPSEAAEVDGEFVMHKNQPAPERLNFANHLWNCNRGWSAGSDYNGRERLDYDEGELDKLGYPVLDPGSKAATQIVVPNDGSRELLQGRMTVTWRGSGAFDVSDGAAVVERGEKRLELDVSESFNLILTAGADYRRDPVRHLRVWVPDPEDVKNSSLAPSAGEAEPVIHPTYVDYWEAPGVSVWRMAFAQFNNNPQSTWEDTRHPDHCFMIGSTGRKEVPGREPRTSERNEVAWQQCVAMVNALDVDLWINVPHGAEDSYVRNLARLVLFGSDENGVPYKSRQANPAYPALDSKHKVYVELSNEMWHPGYHQGVWAYQQHEKLGIPWGAVPARRVSEIWSLFQEEFEKAGVSWKDRLVRVAACSDNRIAWSRDFVAQALKHGKALPDLKPEETMGGSDYTQATRPDVLATANYFGNNIDQYAIEMSKPGSKHPFWDESDAPLDAVFREWQRRLITGGSGMNWVNATKGTIERDFIEIAGNNGLALIGYEGGYGGPSFQRDNVYVKYPEVEFKDRKNKKEREAPGVVKGNLMQHAQRVAKMSNAPGNVGDIFSRFIRFRVMEAQGMEDVMRLQLELLKSGGMRLPCNSSEFDNPAPQHDWGLAEYLPEPLAEAPRRRAALAFAAEHRNLNEVGQANGKGAPAFTTPVSLPVYIGRPVKPVKIEAGGGDGDLQIRVFGYWLADGMIFDKETLTLSGTPQTDRRSYIFARVQDSDGDIAYETFMTEVFDPDMGEPYWRETFNDLADGTSEDKGDTAWSISREGDVIGTCQVANGVLEAVGVKEEKAKGEFIWKSQDIDISNFQSANLFVRATSNQEVDRGGDWLRIYYILDDAEPVQIADFSGQNAVVVEPEITVKDLKGKTLRVEARMTNMNIEMYGLDEVSVFVPEK